MMHSEYIRLKSEVGEGRGGSTMISWPHLDDFEVSPGERPVEHLFGLHYINTFKKLALAVDRFEEASGDGNDVANCADILVHHLELALAEARKLHQFAQERNRCLSAGPGCDHPECNP